MVKVVKKFWNVEAIVKPSRVLVEGYQMTQKSLVPKDVSKSRVLARQKSAEYKKAREARLVMLRYLAKLLDEATSEDMKVEILDLVVVGNIRR